MSTPNLDVTHLTKEQILDFLQEVKDPEIPTISVVDLGIIREVEIINSGNEKESVRIEMIPTFSGCSAVHFMKFTIEQVLKEKGVLNAIVEVNRNKQWSSSYVTEQGRKQLLDFGLSPPPSAEEFQNMNEDLPTSLTGAMCPKCYSVNTQLKSPFGPTLCRAIHYCNDCSETFEQFKPV